MHLLLLKETRNSFKKCPLNLWWISNKTIMEVGNIAKAASFKSFLHLSYKSMQLPFFVKVLFKHFHVTNIHQWFFWGGEGGGTQKYELRVSFNKTSLLQLLSSYVKYKNFVWKGKKPKLECGTFSNNFENGSIPIKKKMWTKM